MQTEQKHLSIASNMRAYELLISYAYVTGRLSTHKSFVEECRTKIYPVFRSQAEKGNRSGRRFLRAGVHMFSSSRNNADFQFYGGNALFFEQCNLYINLVNARLWLKFSLTNAHYSPRKILLPLTCVVRFFFFFL